MIAPIASYRVSCARKMLATAIWLLAVAFVPSAFAEPKVTNVRAAQRAGTNLVDVYYDLSGAETDGATISVALSGDGGTHYGLSVTSLTDDIGSGIHNALNRHIVWNAGNDHADFASSAMRLRISASNATPDWPSTGFALIPAGSFLMGDSFNEGSYVERPVHLVTLSAFYIGRTEVTYAQWQEVRTWALANNYTDLPTGSGKAADHPVHTVSWSDVVKWCNAASERNGLNPVYRTDNGDIYRVGKITPVIAYGNSGYRLPTDAEWEKAARGGQNGQRFPWGNTITHSEANYYSSANYGYDLSVTRGNHPSFQTGGFPYTSPVGSFLPNGYGLFDMAGNVYEWCNDWMSSGYDSSPSIDPHGPTSGSNRLARGGSWTNFPYCCRTAERFAPLPSGDWLGFRIVRNL